MISHIGYLRREDYIEYGGLFISDGGSNTAGSSGKKYDNSI